MVTFKRNRTSFVLALTGLGALLLTGCASGQADDIRDTPTASMVPTASAASTDDTPAAAAGTPVDASIAATCAAVSLIGTTEDNARTDLRRGAISAEQYISLIDASATGFDSLLALPEAQRGLREDIQAVITYIASAPTSAEGARFDPTAPDYRTALEPVRTACATNLSEISTFSTTGG